MSDTIKLTKAERTELHAFLRLWLSNVYVQRTKKRVAALESVFNKCSALSVQRLPSAEER